MVTDNIVIGDHRSCISRGGGIKSNLRCSLKITCQCSPQDRLDAVSLLRSSLMGWW